MNTRRKLGRYIKKNKHKINLNKLQTSGQPTGLFLTVHHMAYTKYPKSTKKPDIFRTNKVESAHCEFDLLRGIMSDFRPS